MNQLDFASFPPEIMREHQSHDILLMCYDCHKKSNLYDLALRTKMAVECGAPIGTEDDVKVSWRSVFFGALNIKYVFCM